MRQLAVVMLALFDQMERTYAIEQAARAQAVATSKGRPIRLPSVVDPSKLSYAEHLRHEDHEGHEGQATTQIVEKPCVTRSSL